MKKRLRKKLRSKTLKQHLSLKDFDGNQGVAVVDGMMFKFYVESAGVTPEDGLPFKNARLHFYIESILTGIQKLY